MTSEQRRGYALKPTDGDRMRRIFDELIDEAKGKRDSVPSPHDKQVEDREAAKALAAQEERIIDLAYELERAGFSPKIPDGLSLDISHAAGRVRITLESIIDSYLTRITLEKPSVLAKPGQMVNTDIGLEVDRPIVMGRVPPQYYFFDGNGNYRIIGSNPVYDKDFRMLKESLGSMEKKLLEGLGRTSPEPQSSNQ